MNALNMIISKNKFVVINKLKFSLFFTQLNHYIDFVKYLWQYIFQYTFIIRPLQNQKTLLNKKIKSMKNVHRRKNYINKLFVDNFIDKKIRNILSITKFFFAINDFLSF